MYIFHNFAERNSAGLGNSAYPERGTAPSAVGKSQSTGRLKHARASSRYSLTLILYIQPNWQTWPEIGEKKTGLDFSAQELLFLVRAKRVMRFIKFVQRFVSCQVNDDLRREGRG